MNKTSSASNAGTMTLLAFIGFVVISGGASVAIRFSYGELPTFWGAAFRFIAAAAVFWVLALVQKIPIPRGRALLGAALFGFFSVGLSFTLIYFGLVKIPASLYQVTGSTVPLITLIIAALLGQEKFTIRGLSGALLAVVGLVIALSGTMSANVDISLPHMLAIVGGAGCFAASGIVAKGFPRSHPIATNAVGMTVGAVMLTIDSLIAGETWVLPQTTTTWLVMAYLILGTSVIAFIMYLYILSNWTASATAYAFVLIPFVTVILAAWLLGEVITPLFVVGGLVTLAGVYVGALMPAKK